MAGSDQSELLRPGLLRGRTILLARAAPLAEGGGGELAQAIGACCEALGAEVFDCIPVPADPALELELEEQEAALDREVERVLAATGGIDLLVVDGAGLHDQLAAGTDAVAEGNGDARSGVAEAGGAGARGALLAGMEAGWSITRAVAGRAFIERERPGRILYIAPRPGAGAHAEAMRAGLENLARTLSTEWARHLVTAVAVAPGDATPAGEVGALSAYLASPAGDYFSGCLLDLRGARAEPAG